MALSFVVGYQTKAVGDSGFTLITPTFEKVDGSSFTLGDIGGDLLDFESIQTITTDGATLSEYIYFTEASGMGLETGWYDGDFNSANSIPIESGASILFASQGSTAVMFAGAVATEDITITTAAEGFTAIGNGTPVGITIKDLVFEGLNDFDSIQTITSDGATDKELIYFTAESGMGLDTGWYDGDFNPADDEPIPAGSGILFSANNAKAVVIKIPSAL